MKVIPGIKLDVYQMIYFVMKHAYHHLNQVNTLESIKTSLNSKIISNKVSTLDDIIMIDKEARNITRQIINIGNF